MRPRRLLASLLAASASAWLAGPAVALEPGVHVNPSSPAGIEYSFPLGSARTQLSGQPASSSATLSSGPLFGVGIEPGGVSGVERTQSARHSRTEAGARIGSIPRAGNRVGVQVRKLEATADGGSLGDQVLLLVGGVLLTGVLGGSLGPLFRRRAVDSW